MAEGCAGEEGALWPNGFPVGAEELQQPRGKHDITVLTALTLTDSDDHALAVDVADLEGSGLGDPQVRGISGHEDGALLEIADGRKETSHFFRTEHDGKGAGLLDRRDGIRDMVAAQRDTIQESQGGTSLLVVAEGDTALLHEVDQVGTDVFGAEVLRRGVEVAGQASDAPDVGADGLGGEVAEDHVLDHAAA